MNEINQSLVSIVIPVFNGANYLREAIESVLVQTYKHLEIIVVNDGSMDETEQIALSYRDKIRYLFKENGGVSTALNMGITSMLGEYFLWLSHDDILKPDAIEKMIILLSTKPSDGIVYGNFDFIDEKSKIYQKNDYSKWFPRCLLEWSVFPVITGLSNACVTMIHKRHFDRVGLFDETLLYSQDLAMLFKIFRGQSLLFCEDFLGSKRFHHEQTQRVYHKEALQNEDKVFNNFLRELTPMEMCTFSGSTLSFAVFVNNIYGTSDHPLVSEYLKQVITNEKKAYMYKFPSEFEIELYGGYQSRNMLEAKLLSIYQSTSWRITKPIRVFGKILNNTKNFGFTNTCIKVYKKIFKK